jgi:hypothetical protein
MSKGASFASRWRTTTASGKWASKLPKMAQLSVKVTVKNCQLDLSATCLTVSSTGLPDAINRAKCASVNWRPQIVRGKRAGQREGFAAEKVSCPQSLLLPSKQKRWIDGISGEDRI